MLNWKSSQEKNQKQIKKDHQSTVYDCSALLQTYIQNHGLLTEPEYFQICR